MKVKILFGFSKLVLVFLTIILLQVDLSAQTQTFQWVKNFGGTGYDVGNSIVVDHLGNIVSTGYFDSTFNFGGFNISTNGAYDIFIAKYNSVGNVIWVRTAGGINYDYGVSVTVDNQNNVLVTGTFNQSATFDTTRLTGYGGDDIFVAKYDPNGTLLWVKKAGGINYETAGKIVTDNLNNVYVTGSYSNSATFDDSTITGGQFSELFVAKYDPLGVLQWVHGTQSSGNGDCYGEGITINNNNDIMVCGSFADTTHFSPNVFIVSNGSNDMFVAKYDLTGNIVWARGIGGLDYYDDAKSIITDGDNNIYFTGSFSGQVSFGGINLTSLAFADIFVAKYDNSGNAVWVRQEGQINGNIGNDITLDNNDNVGVIGSNNEAIGKKQGLFQEMFIGKYDKDGNEIWNNVYSGLSYVDGYGITADQNNNLIITGYFDQSATIGDITLNTNGVYDILTAKITTPILTISPDTLDFGTVQVDNNLVSSILLNNNSNATVHIDSLLLGGLNPLDFSYSLTGFVDTIPPLQNELLNITFAPSLAGSRSAFLIIKSDADSNPDTVHLTGTGGTPPLSLSSDSLNFGTVDVNSFSERTLTISNSSLSNLIIDSLTLATGNDTTFMLPNISLPDTLLPSDFINLNIRFTPTIAGIQLGALIIYSNAISSPDGVLLFGNGIAGVTVQQSDSSSVGQNVSLDLIPPAGILYTTYQLFYKKTGDLTYQVTNLINNGLSYTADIPSDYSTVRGIQYYAEFSDGLNIVTYPSANPLTNPATLQLKVPQMNYPLEIKKAQYQFVSIPLSLSAPQIDSVLADNYGIYDNRIWRIFRYDPVNSTYVEYPDLTSDFSPGNAFMLINKDGQTFDVKNAQTVFASNSYTITLQPGWNQIGDPFAFPVDWDSVGNSLLLQSPVGWNRDTQQNEFGITVLQPWDGYWINNTTGLNVNLTIPPVASLSTIGKKNYLENLKNDEFVIQLKAALNSTGYSDDQNYIGMMETVDKKLNWLQPPPFDNNLVVDIIADNKKYAQYLVNSSKDGAFWDLAISSINKNKQVNINLDLKSNLPEGFKIWFLDKDRKTPINIINNHLFVNLPDNGKGKYRVIVGTEEFAKNNSNNISLTPDTYNLFQNYPNPFNPTTNIVYQLKEKSTVTLEIYDILGRKVASLINNEIQNAGQHSLIWNGRNVEGNKVASGVYIYRIKANNFIDSKKMILLK